MNSGQVEKMFHLWRCLERFDLAERDCRAQIPQRERSVGGKGGSNQPPPNGCY